MLRTSDPEGDFDKLILQMNNHKISHRREFLKTVAVLGSGAALSGSRCRTFVIGVLVVSLISCADARADDPSGRTSSGLLRELWRARLAVNSPTNVIVGRLDDGAYLRVQGSDAKQGRGGTVEALSATVP